MLTHIIFLIFRPPSVVVVRCLFVLSFLGLKQTASSSYVASLQAPTTTIYIGATAYGQFFKPFLVFWLLSLSETKTKLAPYLTMMAFSVLGGVASCWLTNTCGTSTSRAAKTITGVSFTLAVIFFLSMGLAASHAMGALLSSLALASVALSRGGWSTNHVEIAAPEHAAMLYSVANSASSALSVVSIAVIGKILSALGGGGQPLAWVVAVGMIGAVCGARGIFFAVFAKGGDILFPGAALPGKDLVGAAGEEWRSSDGEGRKIEVRYRRDDMA